jgi:cytochrome c-type biogenesis protein CcmE
MKKTEIILIIILAVVAGIIVATFTSSNESVSFAEAKNRPEERVKIIGMFDKTGGVEYDPTVNPNRTVFFVSDKSGDKQKVELIQKDGKPMGLEQSESVTLEGKWGSDNMFHADFVLMKCPSKYNEQQHSLK